MAALPSAAAAAASADPPPHALPLAPFCRGRRQVVTAFVLDAHGRALIVRRSDRVRDYKGKWGGVSGGVELGDRSLAARALTEIEEEAGLAAASLTLVRCGRPLPVDDGGRRFLVHPFLFQWHGGGDGVGQQQRPSPASPAPSGPAVASSSSPPPVKLNWENVEHAFVTPAQLRALQTQGVVVPLLSETLDRLFAPSPEAQRTLDAIVGDRRSGAAQLASAALAALRLGWSMLYTSSPTGGGGGSAQRPSPSIPDALDRWRSYAFLLATARPSMAAVANAVAGAVDGVMQAAAQAAGAGAESSGSTRAPAVGGALDAAEQRLREAQLRAAVVAARAVFRLWRRQQRQHARRLQQEQEQEQEPGLEAQPPPPPPPPPPPLVVLTLSYSSTVEKAMRRLALLVEATADEGTTTVRPRLVARVLESRPLLEGVRLARQLKASGGSGGWDRVEVYTDAQAAVAARGATAMLVGADAVVVAAGGGGGQGIIINKSGTLPAALACRELGVPVVAVADPLKISPGPVLREGVLGGSGGDEQEEAEEEMAPAELTAAWRLHQPAAEQQDDAQGSLVARNVYFEGTPLALVTGGVVTGSAAAADDDDDDDEEGNGEGEQAAGRGALTAEDVTREAAWRREQYDRVFGLG
jgi:hypothetical protein